MEYPHRRYLVYLVSQQVSSWEILERCRRMGLMPPNDESLREIKLSIPTPPKGWEGKYTRRDVASRRWLRDLGIEELWRGTPRAVQAETLCLTVEVRRDVQSLLILHFGDGEAVRESLLLKYPERVVPTAEGIAYFREVFWDTRGMTREGFLDFIKVSDDYDRLLAASKGDVVTALSLLGIQVPVSKKAFLQGVAAFSHQQIHAHRTRLQGAPARGQDLIGLSTLFRQGIEAVEALAEDEGLGGAGDELVEEAQRFKLRRIKARREILSIDDLQNIDLSDLGDNEQLPVLDPEAEDIEAESLDNVRQFPSKN